MLGLGGRFRRRLRGLLRRDGGLLRLCGLRRLLGLLLPGEEWMAVGADVQMLVATGRARFPGGAAGAVDLGGRISGVDALAHLRLVSKGCLARSLWSGVRQRRKGRSA